MDLGQNYSDFYFLEHGRATKYFWLTSEFKHDKLSQKGYIEDDIKAKNIDFFPETGTTPGDIIGSSWAVDFYSEKFVETLKKNNISNYNKWKITVTFKGKKISYYYIEYSEKPIPLLLEKCEPEYSISSDGTKFLTAMNGYYFDLDKWKGEDFFAVNGKSNFVVTTKFKSILEKAKLKNINFIKISDYSFGKPTKWAKKSLFSKLSDIVKL